MTSNYNKSRFFVWKISNFCFRAKSYIRSYAKKCNYSFNSMLSL